MLFSVLVGGAGRCVWWVSGSVGHLLLPSFLAREMVFVYGAAKLGRRVVG